jgi:hypothetical protein
MLAEKKGTKENPYLEYLEVDRINKIIKLKNNISKCNKFIILNRKEADFII